MSISTAPLTAPPKKKDLGCLGCGCLVLALVIVLFAGLVAGGCYLAYEKMLNLTSTKPNTVLSFDGGDDLYNVAQQKVRAFGHDVEHHQAATIRLSGDEINTLIARNPTFLGQNVHFFVTLANDRGRVQGSVPTDVISQGLPKGRYLNFDTTFGLGFNPDTKNLEVILHHLQLRDQTMPENQLPAMDGLFTTLLNADLRSNPDGKILLDQAKWVEIRDGELVFETQ